MNRRVYSTEQGQICRECQQPTAHCICRQTARQQIAGDGNVRVRRETLGRKGKGVTVISGLALNLIEMESMAKTLKQLCGSGGAVKNGTIEIQGDHRDKVLTFLREKGVQARLSGG